MSSIDQRRIGKAFSIHTASGTAGTAAAPIAIVLIAEFWDWKLAVLSVATERTASFQSQNSAIRTMAIGAAAVPAVPDAV